MSLKTLIFVLIVTLLQSCSSTDVATTRSGLNWNFVMSSISTMAGSYDSVLPPAYAYKRDNPDNGFGEDDYNELEQEMILFNQNKEHL